MCKVKQAIKFLLPMHMQQGGEIGRADALYSNIARNEEIHKAVSRQPERRVLFSNFVPCACFMAFL
jgi:hypothetical protein